MRSNNSKSILIKSGLAASALLLASAASFAQQVNLTAGPASAAMPDGTSVPMWGHSCGAVVTGSLATCAALNPNAAGAWSPVVITVPTGQSLTITLTNNLSFANGNSVPTSLVIVGQLGGGLGDPTQRTTTAPTPHAGLGVTWPVAGAPASTSAPTAPTFTPPPQGPRVQSFATEVAAGATATLTWNTPRPGTYLLESGTHPSIQGPMGLYGILVVTAAPTATAAGIAYGPPTSPTVVNYAAEIPMLLSEIDPVQNNSVSTAINTAGFSEMNVWSGQPGGCGNAASPTYNTCYPPAVNYTPLYYLFNGVAFNKTNAGTALFPTSLGTAAVPITTGNVLVRFVNAGLHMHVPSIVGAHTGTPAVPGFGLIAEDGNELPGVIRVQNEVFLAPGKTYDVIVNPPAPGGTALPVYDRELSLSGNAIARDAGMLAYISMNGAGLPASGAAVAAQANPDTYNSVLPCAAAPCAAFAVTDVSKGVIANDVNVYGVKISSGPKNGVLTLNANGTFSYIPNPNTSGDSFTYCANGSTTVCASVMLGAAPIEPCNSTTCGITLQNVTYTSNVATILSITPPGVLGVDSDAAGYPLAVVPTSVSALTGPGAGTLAVNANGSFNATVSAPGTYSFTYKAQNSQGTVSAASATVTLVFPAGSGLNVSVVDGKTLLPIAQDYRWVIEEDTTFFVDPKCASNPPPAGCPGSSSPPPGGNVGVVPTFGTNFHTSHLPFVAQGCTGPMSCEGGQTVLGQAAVCDVGNGACRPDTSGTGAGRTPVLPSAVQLDPTKRYYISVLPGDAATPFINGCATDPASSTCIGHGMGGAPIPAVCPPGTACTMPFAPVQVLSQASPYQPGKLSLIVFEDDFPLNGEQDAGGGIDVLAPNEPGLGGFNIQLWDPMGGNGDFTGQMTYDMFNQPLTNSLDGTIDPLTQNDACPITKQGLAGNAGATGTGVGANATGMIVTCPKFESDGKTLSPLAGQAVVNNLMQGRFEVIATPGADRIARGEQWLQTNTLDGQKAHDTFIRIGEPTYFQEFGPSGYHAAIGFANPKIINGRKAGVCSGSDPNLTATDCTNTITGFVTTERMSRTPDERLYGSGDHKSFYWTTCFVSFGDPDGEDFSFTTCDADGKFSMTGLPAGTWRVTVFDQWNDMLVDGLSTPVAIAGHGSTTNMGEIATNQWQVNIYTRTFIDDNKDGISQASEAGIPLINTAVRYRDGSLANNLQTDFTGTANFNETFPLFNWYVVETDTTRYKNTGTHVVYDAGGPADGTAACSQPGYPPCGTSIIGANMANTLEQVSVPVDLRIPGSVYCKDADCSTHASGILGGASSSDPPSVCTTTGGVTSCTTKLSTGRIDGPWSGATEGWQSFSGQNNWLEFGKEPYVPGENGGIKGHVIYASTRPFDDPQMLVQTQWEPLMPHVTINLYQEGTAPDGSQSLTLVDTTQTSSWDDWAQGFRTKPDGSAALSTAGKGAIPNMSCPGQSTSDLFYFTLLNQPNYLNLYNAEHGGAAATPLAYGSQYKCYDSMHNWNQLQPAPYDGMYKFPSITATDANGKPTPTGTNCSICTPNHAVPTSDLYYGTPMLPAGKYVVEVVVPPGFELVKEEDKNILIGDNYIAPAVQEFGGLSDIFIMPDQASVSSAYNANNAQNATQSLGAVPNNGIVPGFTPEPTWPCVGAARVVPDYISLFPQSHQVAPFAGATRNLCDRKEVTLADQTGAIAKFYVFTSTHLASKFTGVITDDFTSEFDPFSPQFGEKFSPPNMPVAFKDWTGAETSRVYSDQWGAFNGVTYSTWEVNPPNPTGYSPTMMVTCMNDPGSAATPDPLFNPAYSQFCYELPFMPAWTTYMDTPVVPTSAFAGAGYNNPDCDYPDATPAVSEVDGDAVGGDSYGPWVSAAGHTLTVKAMGDHTVFNYGYSGPAASTAPYNQKTVTRHYGFGAAQGTGSVTIGGVTAPVISWSDLLITVAVPAGVPDCGIQQQEQYGGPASKSLNAKCGELTITAGNGKQSIDAVTVTVGGKAPTHVTATKTMQSAIDAALPGDLIIVDPGMHNEMLIIWKPVRLQGVGAASSVINAITQFGELDPWRAQVNCLFGLALNGQPANAGATLTFPPAEGAGTPNPPPILHNPYDATGVKSCPGAGWAAFTGGVNNPQVDRIPLEGIVGWDTTLNGNLAQLLQEPTLMGAYEGGAITVLGKGVRYPGAGTSSSNTELDPVNPATRRPYPLTNIFGTGADTAAGSFIAHEGQMPVPTVELTGSANDCGTGSPGNRHFVANPFPSNFQCNPSRIDGLAVTDSSQGGGGIFVHGWAHNLEIANNRIYNNTGTLTGGIVIGQGESPDALLSNNNGDPLGYNGGTLAGFDQQPWTCLPGASGAGNVENVIPPGTVANAQLPFCYNTNVFIHHNSVTRNSSIGDELYSGTPAGAGGVTFCTGADYYKFNYNWVCGNMSTGDGGGVSHIGYIWNGDIEHNQILFNQSTNPTIATNGGGIVVMGAAPDGTPAGAAAGTECGSVTDVDCPPGLPDGTGPGMVINANLIMGNAADSGSGGGLRLQSVNGTEVSFFPDRPSRWNSVTVTNNIIANNVAGWDGAGVSLQDALNVNLINNTIVSNDTTASSGVLFNTLGAPDASAPGAVNQTTSSSTSAPQPSGLVTMQNSSNLTATFAGLTLVCPDNHYAGTSARNGTCRKISFPYLANDVFWQNRSFYIGVGSLSAAYQQNIVALYNAISHTPAANQPSSDATTGDGNGVVITGGTGACTPGATYWDLGVRGDTGPGNHGSGYTLAPTYSVLTNASEVGGGSHDLLANPTVISQYCNGSRTPPEALAALGVAGAGWQVPPGIADATVPNPIFSLTPNATVDEGNNWINLSWGPLAEANPISHAVLGNYALAEGSPAINYIPLSSPTAEIAPKTDFFGNVRPSPGTLIDVGAVEFQSASTTLPFVSPTALNFASAAVTAPVTTTAAQTLTLNAGGVALSGINVSVSAGGFSRPAGTAGGTCGTSLTAGATCTINIVFSPSAVQTYTGTATITATGATIDGSPVGLSGTGAAPVRSIGFAPSPLAFGNRTVGTTSTPQIVTVTNTGNIALTGGTNSWQTLVPPNRSGPFRLITAGSSPCTVNLAIGATCTLGLTFSPTTPTASTATLGLKYTGMTQANLTITGTGVTTLPVLAFQNNPVRVTIAPGATSITGFVAVYNDAPAGSANLTISAIAVTGGFGSSGTFTAGPDSLSATPCTNAVLAPQQACRSPFIFTKGEHAAKRETYTGAMTFTEAGGAKATQMVTLEVKD